MATCHRSRNSGSSQARSRTKDILARIDTNGLRQGALTITCWRSVGSFPVPSGFNNMFCVDLRAALAYLLRLLPWDWTCTVGGKWEDIWWEKIWMQQKRLDAPGNVGSKNLLAGLWRDILGLKLDKSWRLHVWFGRIFSIRVQLQCCQGFSPRKPLRIPYETAVDLCRDDFLCCRRSLKSSMIRERHDISWDKRVAFFLVNSFGKVCLFRTGGEGHPTWICSILVDLRSPWKLQNAKYYPKSRDWSPPKFASMTSPPKTFAWKPRFFNQQTSIIASRCYPFYPSAKKLARGRPPFWSSKASCRLLWCRASEAWDASFCT